MMLSSIYIYKKLPHYTQVNVALYNFISSNAAVIVHNYISYPGRSRNRSLLHSVQTDLEALPASLRYIYIGWNK
jgi:hypothetical protein